MLTRRSFSQGSSTLLLLGGGALHLSVGCSPLAAAESDTLSEARRHQILDVSIGSLVGAGLGDAVYARYASQAPPALISTFAVAVGTNSTFVGANLARPSRDYIEYRVETARGTPNSPLDQLKRDMKLDVAAFQQLSNVVTEQIGAMKQFREATGQSLRQMREELRRLRDEIEIVRLERSRSGKSTGIYSVTENELYVSRLDRNGSSKRTIEDVMRESSNLEVQCRNLENAIVQVR